MNFEQMLIIAFITTLLLIAYYSLFTLLAYLIAQRQWFRRRKLDRNKKTTKGEIRICGLTKLIKKNKNLRKQN